MFHVPRFQPPPSKVALEAEDSTHWADQSAINTSQFPPDLQLFQWQPLIIPTHHHHFFNIIILLVLHFVFQLFAHLSSFFFCFTFHLSFFFFDVPPSHIQKKQKKTLQLIPRTVQIPSSGSEIQHDFVELSIDYCVIDS